MPTRTVSILGLIQIAALTGSYLSVNWMMRIWKKGNWDWALILETGWGKWMSFVQNWILLLLLIPIGMTVLSSTLARTHRDIAWMGPGGVGLAIVLTVAVLWFSLLTFFKAMGGPPFLIQPTRPA